MIDTGVEWGVIKKSGNTYAFGEEKLGVGRENAKAYLRTNPKLMDKIYKAVWEAVKEKRKTEN